MEVNELRIGNYVSFNDVWCKVIGIDKDRVLVEYHNGETDYCYIDYIEPIELTEDVLLKIGFEKVYTVPHNRLRLCVKNGNEITRISYDFLFDDITRLEIMGNGDSLNKRNIKYLHELQNSYYCLTNQELEIKL